MDFLWKFLDEPMLFLVLSSGVKAALLWNAPSADRRRLVGRVSRLAIYPVKSMKKVETDRLECLSSGVHVGRVGDRVFMVTVGDDNTFVTARTEPTLVLIQPVLNENQLRLEAEGKERLIIDLDYVSKEGKLFKTGVHGAESYGLDCGTEASEWLDDFLGKSGHRLLYSSPSIYRRSAKMCNSKYVEWTDFIDENMKIAYQDSASFHLLSDSSVDNLNEKLDKPVNADYFRANILVADSQPFSEDTWQKIYIRDVEFTSFKLCSRCILTTVDPDTGKKNPLEEPVKSLRKYRKIVPSFGESPCLGIHMLVEKEGTIAVGDPVYAEIGEIRLAP